MAREGFESHRTLDSCRDPGRMAGPAELVEAFVGWNAEYYIARFDRVARRGLAGVTWNGAAMLGGPIWAAARHVWIACWVLLASDAVGLTLIARAMWLRDAVTPDVVPPGLVVGLGIVGGGRIAVGLLANALYYRRFLRWRGERRLPSGVHPSRGVLGMAAMLVIYPVTMSRFSAEHVPAFLETFPALPRLKRRTATSIDRVVDWMVIDLEAAFDAVTAALRLVLDFLELAFVMMPWPVTLLLLVALAWRVGGWRVGIFSAASLLYIGLFGFWEKAMSTFSLVGAAVAICLTLGGPLGIWCAKNPRVYAVIRPVLDIMQTLPTFVYLIPAVALFSIGKPPAILATVIFALPPMIRLTALGILQVPSAMREAALAFGASPRQLLWKVELPLALPSIMTGVNQTTMLSLSMVVIAALIGAGGLGYDVLFALQHVEIGNGLLAGVAIALLAMVLDRIVQGSREQTDSLREQ